MQTVTTKAVLVVMPGQIFTFAATAGLAGTLTSITGSGTLTHDGTVYSSGSVGAVIAAGDEITIDVPPTGSITSMEIQQSLTVTGTVALADVVGPDQPGYLLGLTAGGDIEAVSPPTELTAANLMDLIDLGNSNVEVSNPSGLLVFTAPDAPPLTAEEIEALVHPDSNIVVEVEDAQLKFTAAEIPTTTLISALRSGTTDVNYGLRSKADGTFELYALGPTGLYDSGGFLTAPSGLSEDLPNDDSPEWVLTSDQFTVADYYQPTGVNIVPSNGVVHYDSSQAANDEWFVQVNNSNDKGIQTVRLGFNANSLPGLTANFSLHITESDRTTIVATTSGVVASGTSYYDFDFGVVSRLPADGYLKLEKTSGDPEVLPQFRGSVTPYTSNNFQTDWLARDAAGAAYTSAAYPGGIGLNIIQISAVNDLVEAETLNVTESSTEYEVSGFHLTRLDVATSDATLPHQYWIVELTAEAHTHPDMLEVLGLCLQKDRSSLDGNEPLFYLARDSTGLELHRRSTTGQIELSSNTLQASLETGVGYRFEFTATRSGGNITVQLTGVWKASDGTQILGAIASHTFSGGSNPLFCLVSGGEADLTKARGVNVGRPMPVTITRWVEWRA